MKENDRNRKKLTRREKKAVQAETYEKQIATVRLQNAEHLIACAIEAAEISPGTADVLKSIIAAYGCPAEA